MAWPPTDNFAAYHTAKFAQSLEVRDAPFTPPSAGEIVIRARAVAINPIDWLKQNLGDAVFPQVEYPFVPGQDVAGDVVEVGNAVTRLNVGDRVAGMALGMHSKVNSCAHGAFQKYVVLQADFVTIIPQGMEFEKAVVLPFCLSTAATALFDKKYLGLDLPPADVTPSAKGEVLLVWRASTDVGMNAVQLAVNAGYDVYASASEKNRETVKTLGATNVWDYRSTTVVQDIVAALKDSGKPVTGAVAVGTNSTQRCIEIIGASGIIGNKLVVEVGVGSIPTSSPRAGSWAGMLWKTATLALLNARTTGVRCQVLRGGDLMVKDVARAVFTYFLPVALQQGKYVAAPESAVFGHGLDKIQEAMDRNREGVSAQKIVVTI